MAYVTMMDTPSEVHECAREVARVNVGDWDGVTFCGRVFYWTGDRYTGVVKAAIQPEIGREHTGPSNCVGCLERTRDISGYLIDEPVLGR